jgi:hypothetical protein
VSGEALDRKSIQKDPFFFYLFVYDHIIMVEKTKSSGFTNVIWQFYILTAFMK